MPKKQVPIKYTSKDFATIRDELVAHAKRYYPDTFKDFNEAGFGSMMIDAVAYIGDQLSFYGDYQANESFMSTAFEYNNIIKHARQMGFKFKENYSSHGIVTFFILVPANTTGLGPDTRYIPILKKDTVCTTNSGNEFTLIEDVRFDGEDNEIVVGEVNEATGLPTSYAIRGYGRVISGTKKELTMSVGEFARFLRLKLDASDIAEVISVEDAEGHEYFEVDYLSQDVIYRPITNRTDSASDAPSLLRPFTVPRRYVVDREEGSVYLQFGYGTDESDVTADKIADPSAVVLEQHGKDYIADSSVDPTNLIKTDRFGVVPSNTTLSIVIRSNTQDNINAGVDTIINVSRPIFEFTDITSLSINNVDSVKASIECTNEEPVVGKISTPTTEELKQRVFNSFAAQNRAVTREDYISLVYQMPPIYGGIKRVNVMRDTNSLKRNLNMYVVSENANGKLTATNQTVKENLKVWLNKNRMINDTIDILDAKILNIGIDYEVIGDLEKDKFDILADCSLALEEEFTRVRDIGEHIFISELYSILKDVEGVVDVTRIHVKLKTGAQYSDIRFNIEENMSVDGRYINIPRNCIIEVKYPEADIKGVVK